VRIDRVRSSTFRSGLNTHSGPEETRVSEWNVEDLTPVLLAHA
jgi:hypothetical protein